MLLQECVGETKVVRTLEGEPDMLLKRRNLGGDTTKLVIYDNNQQQFILK